MLIKILDPNLTVTLHGEPKVTFEGGHVYEVDNDTGRRLINAYFAVEVFQQEMEKENHETIENA